MSMTDGLWLAAGALVTLVMVGALAAWTCAEVRAQRRKMRP